MLKNLKPFENKIDRFVKDFENEEYLKYYTNSTYNNGFHCADSTWAEIGRASVDEKGELLGFIRADLYREDRIVSNIVLLNMTKKPNVTFARDTYEFLAELFDKYSFHKIKFTVTIGNPAEKIYDKIIEQFNGRVAGIAKDEVMLYDYKYYDQKLYEILKEDYLKSKVYLIKKGS